MLEGIYNRRIGKAVMYTNTVGCLYVTRKWVRNIKPIM
jgi:hypothetical protein